MVAGKGSVDVAGAAKERDAFLPEARVRVIEMRGDVEQRSDITKGDASQPAQASNQVTREDYAAAFTTLGALDPIYDPEMLAILFEHSNSLRQNVDAYATNIDGFGHRFDPHFDLDAPDVDHKISHAMLVELERQIDEEGAAQGTAKDPTPDEVKAKKVEIARQMRRERHKLEHFFEFCCADLSFVTLRRWTRQDLEVIGNAYWEVLRNLKGDIAQFVYISSFTIRLLPLDMEPVTVKRKVRVSDLAMEDVEYRTRLRRFAQIVEGRTVFFKSFGDPRIVSAETGAVYPSVEAMTQQEPKAVPATEVLHFKIHSPRSAYGVPRWIGNLLAVIGSRQAEEVNFNYFENKSVPPLAILVSGGRMSEDSVSRVQDYIETNLKGKRNFHKILVLEAEPPGGQTNTANTARMKIDIRPLTNAQQQDALFQEYDERNIDKVGQAFRLPRMLRGDIRDFNRSTADAALTFAEVQVFEPERQEFDFIINRKLISAMGINFWKFVSLAPVIRDAVSMSEIIRNLANANVLTPAECRELAGDVFNREFKKLSAAWTKQPGAFTIAGIPAEPEAAEPPVDPENPVGEDAGEEGNFGEEGGPVAPARPPGEGVTARSKLEKTVRKIAKHEIQKAIALREAIGVFKHDAWKKFLLEQSEAAE